MRPRWVSLFVVVAVSAGPLYSQVSLGRVTLTTDVAEVLPGLPVAFRAELLNDSPVPVPAPGAAALLVTPEEGVAFFATPHISNRTDVHLGLEEREPLQPGEVQRYTWRYEHLMQPWFTDERLSQPGTYELQLLLLPSYVESDVVGPEELRSAIVSNRVRLKVIEPASPADRAVWDRMKKTVSRDLWSNFDWAEHVWGLAKYVVDEQRESKYFPYLAPAYPARTDAQLLEIIRAAAAKAPPSSDWYAELRLMYASLAEVVISARRVRSSRDTSDAPDDETLKKTATALLREGERAPVALELKVRMSGWVRDLEKAHRNN